MKTTLALVLALTLAACGGAKQAVVRDGFVLSEGLYRVATPPDDWQSLKDLGTDTLRGSQVIYDGKFAKCPETWLITVGRASYRQAAAKPGSEGNPKLVDTATALLEEIHNVRRNALTRMRFDAQIVTVARRWRAVEVTYEVDLPTAGFCDPDHRAGRMKERYLLVDTGRRGLGMSLHAGLWAQKFILLHFESPAGRFEEGLVEFRRVANSLEFIDKE